MSMETTVRLALKDKNPALFKELSATGKLAGFVTETADQISERAVSMMQEMRLAKKWDNLDPMTLAQNLKAAHATAREIALAEMLEFPQGEPSR
jgi:hypothetical protein